MNKKNQRKTTETTKKNMAAGSAFPAYNEHPAAPADSTCNRKGGRRSTRRRK